MKENIDCNGVNMENTSWSSTFYASGNGKANDYFIQQVEKSLGLTCLIPI